MTTGRGLVSQHNTYTPLTQIKPSWPVRATMAASQERIKHRQAHCAQGLPSSAVRGLG